MASGEAKASPPLGIEALRFLLGCPFKFGLKVSHRRKPVAPDPVWSCLRLVGLDLEHGFKPFAQYLQGFGVALESVPSNTRRAAQEMPSVEIDHLSAASAHVAVYLSSAVAQCVSDEVDVVAHDEELLQQSIGVPLLI
jgi:hypothetical protein